MRTRSIFVMLFLAAALVMVGAYGASACQKGAPPTGGHSHMQAAAQCCPGGMAKAACDPAKCAQMGCDPAKCAKQGCDPAKCAGQAKCQPGACKGAGACKKAQTETTAGKSCGSH